MWLTDSFCIIYAKKLKQTKLITNLSSSDKVFKQILEKYNYVHKIKTSNVINLWCTNKKLDTNLI